MTSTESKFSYNNRVDTHQITIRGESFAELSTNMGDALGPDAAAAILQRIADGSVPLSAGDPMPAAVAAVQPIAHQQQPAGYGAPAPAPAPLPASAPTAGGPPQCAHGDRKWVTSKPGAPKAWQAWMCGARQGDPTKCDPQWA